ncbi:DUF1758 domain-containing protein [Trichonephila clavipes]|nr:DUF1758 domain-containing protein [Trichonephila clavipes]
MGVQVQSPSEERGNSRDKATTSLLRKRKATYPVVDKETLVIYTFGSEAAEKRTYDIVEVTLQNVQTNKHIKIQVVVIDSITSARIRIPSKFIRNITLERGSELADNSTSERIDVLMGSDYISEILGDRNIKISKRLIAVDSIFGYLIQGKEDEVNCKDIFANNLIVENEEFDFDKVRNLWSLETIGINPDNEVPWSDKEILKSFEQNTVYRNKRYETRLLWKEDSRELKSNYEIAKRRLLGLSKTFEKNEELYLKYDEIIKEHLRDGIIERVNMNLDKNINTGCFLHAVVREQKDSTEIPLRLHEAWKRANIDCRETSQVSGVPLKILGIIWDNVNDNLKIDIKQFEKLNNLVKVTKRVVLSASGMLFDPIGVMNPFTIRMKLLLQRKGGIGHIMG